MACLLNCNPDQINFYGLQDAGFKPHFKQWFLTNHILFWRREPLPLWASWQMEISKFAYSESRVTNFFYLCGSLWDEIISEETFSLFFTSAFLLKLHVLPKISFDEQFGRKTKHDLTSHFQTKVTQQEICKFHAKSITYTNSYYWFWGKITWTEFHVNQVRSWWSTKALTKYERLKMKRDARRKCSLFL